MSDPTPGPISDDLTQLLTDWIETDTWDESQVILRANADRLLSDEALERLNELLAESAEDEDATRILLTHKAILEAARAESIDAAYAELLEESPLELALKALPDELRDALEAMIAAENATKLLEQIAQHPILLTPQAMAAIEHVMDELRQAGQEPIVRGIQERFNTVRQVQAASRPIDEELAQLLIDWTNAGTWEQSRELLKAHAERLLSNEALETLARLLLLELGEDEEDENKDSRKKTLLQHQALLELARTESIDIAYDTLLRPSPLAVAMQALPHELRDALQAMIAARGPTELLEQTRHYPILLTTQAATAIDTLLDELRQANQEDTVDFINERYDTLKRISESARDPLNVAINALLRADNPYELQQAIAQHPLLLSNEAMKALEEIITRTEQNGDAVLAQRLRFRLDEVRRIRKQREQPARNGRPALVNDDLERGHVEISAERNSIAVGRSEGSITQTNINIENLTLPPKKWQTPKRQSLPKAFVGREKELQDVHDYLVAGQAVAITGRATATMLQGMAGIGKTYLAVKLGMDLQAHFPGGVIRVNLGPEVTSEEKAQVKLRELADYAFEGNLLQVAGQLQPEQVAAWLQEMAPGRLLVIFDDVWRQEPLLFLERALPADAVRIVTSRDANIVQALAGKRIPLDRMTDEDGVALLEDRLDCEGNAAYRAELEALVKLLGGHALALDIAAARIKNPRRIRTVLDDLKKGVGQATLDRLKLPRGETRETNLEKSLALSYEQMTGEEKSRFRALGAFAVETPITVEAVTAIWGMEELADAQNALYDLVDLALLEEFEGAMGTSYRQHNLLHVYAYALLDKEGELNSASWAHAEYYKNMALRAETATPKDYTLLDRHLQDLQAALRWADKYEPRLFAQLVEVLSQFLQLRGQFELLEVYLPRAIATATATEDKRRQANVLRSLGDLERRLGNLDQARAHYDAALPLYQAVRNRLGEANVLRSLGDLEERLGNLDQARAHYDAALPLFQAERTRLGEANVYMSLADIFLTQKEWTPAKIHYEQALPLFVTERDPLGQANTLIDLGRARFELGEHEQGMQDIQRAAELFRSIQDEEWARRAERYFAEMRARLGLSVAGNEHSLSQDNELVQAFIGVESVQAMLQLVQQHPQLLSDEWFIVVEELIAAQAEEDAKQALRERLDTLKQFRHDIELQGTIDSEIVSLLDEFARADWPKRRQLLTEHADVLLSENIEPVFDELLKVSTDSNVIESLGHLRVLLRRCRAWGIEPTEYFESGMRLGDSIEIPSEYEPDVQHIATLLSGQRDDSTAHERAIEAMQALVNGLPPATPELFRGALLRDLADTMGVLPEKHPQRKLEQMEAYYREALPLYQAADRPISVAYIQRSLGDVLSEQGRYNEALAPLQAASLGLQTHEHIRDDAAWAFSSYGSVLDNLGQIEEALAAYTEAMKLLPESAALYRNRAETLIHARRLEEAEADLVHAVGLDGNEDSPYLWYRRVQIAVARGEGSLVDQMFDEVMKRDASFDVAFLQAQSAWLHGDIKAALEGLQNTLEKANEGDRASMRREMERLVVEHPELDGRAELQDILMKFAM